jgi:hypothetical protein
MGFSSIRFPYHPTFEVTGRASAGANRMPLRDTAYFSRSGSLNCYVIYFVFFLLSIFSDKTIKKYPGRIIKNARKTFHMFIKAKNRVTKGYSENIIFMQYDIAMTATDIINQCLPVILSACGSLFI